MRVAKAAKEIIVPLKRYRFRGCCSTPSSREIGSGIGFRMDGIAVQNGGEVGRLDGSGRKLACPSLILK